MSTQFDWHSQTFDVIGSKFKEHGSLVAHQLCSFNDMMERTIPALVMQSTPLIVKDRKELPTVEHKIEFSEIGFSKPVMHQPGQGYLPMLPKETIRDLTYGGQLFMRFKYTQQKGDETTEISEDVCLGKLPVMIGSKFCHSYGRSKAERAAMGLCPNDNGGYFIIKGSEKVIISQERPAENTIFCFKETDTSKPYVSRVEVKSTIDQRFFPIKIAIIRLTKYQEPSPKDTSVIPGHKLMVSLPYGKRPVPLFVIFKAYGITSDKEIFSYLLENSDANDQDFINLITPSALETHGVVTQADALRYIANSININITTSGVQTAIDQVKGDETLSDEGEMLNREFRMKYAADLLNREFLPHTGNNPTRKLRYIGLMVQQLINCKLGRREYSDRDKLTNKRLDLPGSLLFQIFRFYFQKMLKDVKTLFVKAIKSTGEGHGPAGLAQEIKKIIQRSNIQHKIEYALSTGNWYTNRSQANSASKKGTAQVLQRLAYLGTLSHMRRVYSPLERAGSKHVEPREYHGTQPPKICPAETPEGAQVGSVKNLSLMTHVSIEHSSHPVMHALGKLDLVPVDEASTADIQGHTGVLVNGDFVGIVKNPVRVFTILRHLRRIGVFNPYMSISWSKDNNQIYILTDGGRYLVPYYIVNPDGHLQIDNWQQQYSTLPSLDKMLGELETSGSYSYNEIYRESDHRPWRDAAIEYLDTQEEETMMIAIRPEQLFTFQTFKDIGGSYYGSLTPAVKLPLTSEQRLEQQRLLEDRAKLRQYEDLSASESLREDLLKRRAKQDTVEPEIPLMEAISLGLEESARELFRGCVESVELVDPHNTKRLVKITPKGSLNDNEEGLLTNLNRFLTRDYVPYTHLLLHPCIIHGVVAANIPFPDHNQSPRNCYQSSMGKQAIGAYVTNHNERMDTMSNVLVYPQRPLVAPRTAEYTNMDKMFHGANTMIAIATYSGYNQEDSLVGNLSSAQRGWFNTAWTRTYEATLQKLPSSGASESFEVPPERTIGRKIGSGGRDRYHAIQQHHGKAKGRKPELPKVGSIVTGNDIIIPKSKKITPKKKNTGEVLYTDMSVTVKPSEGGVIDLVIPNEHITNNENEDAYQFVKVRLCEMRQPEIGDKFASRAAQKGTEGIQLNSADVMFAGNGVAPDKIFNPQGIPSRMTHGQLLESICSKEGALTGKFHDATPFTDFDLDKVERDIELAGYDRCGEEIMYNGFTGEPMESPITLWPTYYQRLKHMVADKMHARALGPIQALTKQPAEGRSKMGGLRLGEMERDCLIAHACAWFLKEKMMESSDIFEVFMSKQKRTVIGANPKMGIYQYGTEDIYGHDDVCKVHMPYAMNLFQKELQTILVDTEMIV